MSEPSRAAADWLMPRHVSSHLEVVLEAPTEVVLSVAVAAGEWSVDETLVVELDGRQVPFREVRDEAGTRLHLGEAGGAGVLTVDYRADVGGRSEPLAVTELDRVRYTRPSRYCESDRLAGFVQQELRGLEGMALVDAATSWVGTRVAYLAGASRPTDGAVATLLAQQGVCRDFAHLVVALLRARDVPARVVSAYAPGLQPMDFHAVAEVAVDGLWHVADATCLAPRAGLVRIATGRDAADIAFLTTTGAPVTLTALEVTAVVDGDLPPDDLTRPAHLG